METQKLDIFFQNFEIEFCPFPKSPYSKKRNHRSFVDISPTLIIDTSMERSSQDTAWRPRIIYFFQKISKLTKLNFFRTYPEKRNNPRFVNISPTLVIDTTMGMSFSTTV